ncbi:exported hypothetical protein [Candidatus Sulfopaludibacter sp. SbA4]|nr:exported hypothetical protein [Candidatus Sulfopaludibacter sp. SbA4]
MAGKRVTRERTLFFSTLSLILKPLTGTMPPSAAQTRNVCLLDLNQEGNCVRQRNFGSKTQATHRCVAKFRQVLYFQCRGPFWRHINVSPPPKWGRRFRPGRQALPKAGASRTSFQALTTGRISYSAKSHKWNSWG